MKAIRRFLPTAQTVSFVLLMLLCLLVFGLLKPSYATWDNLYSMVLSACVAAVLAAGMGVVISAGGFDLCVGHTAGFSALMCGFFLRTLDFDPIPAMLLAIGMAVAIGAINGLLVSRMGISSFIVTLGMQFVLVGARQWITAGNSYRVSNLIKGMVQSAFLGVSNLVWISAAMLGVIGFVMQKTPFGRKIQFTGANIVATALNGTPTRLYTFLAFLISGAISGVVGILQFGKLTSATINMGDGWLFNAMTIAVFSSVIFGRFKAHGLALVSFLITMITTGINMQGVSSAWTNFVLGVILLASLFAGKFIHFDSFGKKPKRSEDNGCQATV
ncbi:MAG: ABC transporter permease [Clostridiales bacterium]|nr:ABC transporter permease [Clostridiales bacterium]